MARRCTICGKKSIIATVRKKLRGKYNPTTKKRKYPNLQWATLKTGEKVKACTKCVKTLSKVRIKTTRADRLKKRLEKVAQLKKEQAKKVAKEQVKKVKAKKVIKPKKTTKAKK